MYDLPLTFLNDEKTPAFVLLSIIIKKYDTEALAWEPELLRHKLEADYDIKLTDLQSDKIQAAIIILTTDSFENHWIVFEKCCHILNNMPDDFTDFEPLEPEEIALAMPEVEMIKNGDEDGLHFSDEVNAYAGRAFYDYGMCSAPVVFPSAILPTSANECDMSDKNAALLELYNARKEVLLSYVNRLKVMHS